MKKQLGIFLIFLIAGCSILFYHVPQTKATNPPIIQWTRTYPTLNQSSSCVVQTNDGGYAIAGSYLSLFDANSGYAVSYGLLINSDSLGKQIWNTTYSIGDMWYCSADSVVQTSDGGYALIMHGTNPPDVHTSKGIIKTDSAGNPIWNVNSNTAPGMISTVTSYVSVISTNDGQIAWGGSRQVPNQSFPSQIYLTKVSLSGNPIWDQSYGNGTARCVVQTADGGYAILGQKLDGTSELIKTDSAGNSIWVKTYGNYYVSDLLLTSDGGFAFLGGIFLFKTDGVGNLQWMQTSTGTLGAQTSDGGFLLLDGNKLLRTDSTGNLQSTQTFGATLSSIIRTSNQEFVLAGSYSSSSAVNRTVWLTKISLPIENDWPMYHYDAFRSGYTTSNVPIGNQLLWSYATGGAVSSSPAVVNGVVYVGSADGNVYAFNAVSGSKIWSYATGGAVSSSPAVVNGVVYVGSADGNVYAFNAVSGSKIWSYATGGAVYSSPAVANGVVYIASSNRMLALDSSTGNLLWFFNGGGLTMTSSPTVANGKVYVVLWVTYYSLYVFDASTGTQLRSTPLGNHAGGTVAVVDGVMVGELAGYGTLSASDASTGSGLWSHPIGNFFGPCPAIADGVVYAGIDSTTYSVYACDATTGTYLWSYAAGSHVESSPAVTNGVVYVGSDDGNINALNAATGTKLWSYITGGAVVSSPAISNGKLYVGSNDGKLYCFGSPKSLSLNGATGWYWQSNTVVNSVASGDVNDDGQKEIVTGGSYFDGTRNIAQLIVWDSSNLVAEKIQCWYWTGNTVINSVAVGDVDGDGKVEIVTGGYFNDGLRNVAQLIVWDGANLAVKRLTSWYWTGYTTINSVAAGDVDGDGQVEVVIGGSFYDGARNVAQLIEWNGANLAVDRLTSWYWTGNTVINSVAAGDVDGDGQVEVVTGGSFYDGARNVAQLIEWNGANLAVDRLTGWYWTGNTVINSVAVGDVDVNGQAEVVTGGYFFDGTRNVAQLIEWNGANLAVARLNSWYWTSNTVVNSVAIGDVDGDGQVEVATGGYFNDGTRNVAQLIEWNGATLALDRLTSWYWTSNTAINSVAIGDADGDSQNEAITGGYFNDGTRNIAQLTIWGMI